MPINVGSCGLHVVHGGFKYGLGKTGSRLDRLMRCLYYLFYDAPARRYDYRQVNDGVVVYPLKFCNTRWLEDIPVAERAIAVWPKVVKYVEETNKLPRSKQPGSDSYIGVKEFVPDTLV